MTTIHSLAFAILLTAGPALVASQQVPAPSRAQQLAAAFTKHKHVVSSKRGVRREKYKDVRSEPVVRQDIASYSGTYHADLGDVIDLRIGNDGRVQGTGADSSEPARTFILENAKITGAVLTATKVYRDGATERFEGVFINRTEREAPNDPGVTVFGLGVLLTTPREFGGQTYDRLFYKLEP